MNSISLIKNDSEATEISSAKEQGNNACSDPPLPDGDLTAWVQCAGAFVLFFNSWGLVNAFGVFQEFYQLHYLQHSSASQISWIGSVQSFLLVFGSCISGPLLDMGYLRSLVFCGSVVVVFGMMMLSLSTEYWQVFVSQGVVTGLGFSCLFMPSVGTLPTYFIRRRALATGIAAAGSSLGAIVYITIFQNLQHRIGFAWAIRVMSFTILITQAIPILGMKQRTRPSNSRNIVDVSALRETPFILWLVTCFFSFLGLYVPLFYLQLYASQEGTTSPRISSYLQIILNTGSFFGRIVPNYLADRAGSINALIPCLAVAGILAFSWLSVTSSGSLIALCVFYGFFSGAFVSLAGPITALLCPTASLHGTRLGMVAVCMSLGLLVGNPIAGVILTRGYTWLEVYCGTSIFVGLIMLTGTRISKAGLRLIIQI